jgi:hypothetical protein
MAEMQKNRVVLQGFLFPHAVDIYGFGLIV